MTPVDPTSQLLGRLEAAVERAERVSERLEERLGALDKRVGSLESSRSAVLGGAGVLGAIGGFIADHLWKAPQ